MDILANIFMRAPGESVGTYALECAIDELAEAMQLDPIELRRRIEPEKDPTSGTAFSSRHLVDAYRRGAERFGWDRRDPTPRSRREGEWLIEWAARLRHIPITACRWCGAHPPQHDGLAIVQMASHEMGMGTAATVQAQIAAERLGLEYEKSRSDAGTPRCHLAHSRAALANRALLLRLLSP
jgi:xanthine dehydrogenase YagR molybdenum-binding subunit